MDVLAELFGSQTLVKVIRLFYLNPEEVFNVREVSKKIRSPLVSVRHELRTLEKTGFIKEGRKQTDFAGGKSRKLKKKRIVYGWTLNRAFALFRPLKNIVLNTAPIPRDVILARLKKSGRLTLVVLSGIFIDQETDTENDDVSRIDILVVGDGIKKPILDKIARSFEAQLGKELNYSMLSSKEFLYRLGMRDKFIRDILDYPHEKILNKLGV